MFIINPSSSQPIYEQVIAQVKENILRGALREGEKLPSVRELAEITRVNPNTISKAYKILEQDHIIVTLRGRGTYVNQDLDIKTDTTAVKDIEHKLKNIIIELHYLGLNEEAVIESIKEIYSELRKETDHAQSGHVF